ncbi:helix-turn-helix domain-containing protein [Isoptericola haloaureus]|uniref:Helix-turn-helix domain-containing protein n=1 Tax=Isoptericola haloaureus TaxID=1542902 RepID=A0ABU7Z8S3_9MICO
MPASTAGDAPPRVRYRGRHLPMVAVVIAAFIATALAYSGMVLFGLEVANMAPLEAYALAGFLEVSLVAVALMARNAALEGRPYGVLLTLTWILSGTSGVFAALHEVAVPNESTPYMVVFRFVPPLVAALMWHLALVGERHLVTGHTLDERRREHRVHQYVTALEEWRDARLDNSGNRRGTQKVRAAHQRQRAARDRALKLLTVEDFERRMQVWVQRLEAAERHGSRLDSIGASSVKRGMVRGVTGWSDEPAPAPAAAPAPAGAEDGRPAPARAATPFEAAGEQPYEPATAFEELPAFESRVRQAFAMHEPAVPVEAPAAPEEQATAPVPGPATSGQASAGTTKRTEPLPETGHTRRVEVFDLADRAAAPTAPSADVPDWSAVHESAEGSSATTATQDAADDAAAPSSESTTGTTTADPADEAETPDSGASDDSGVQGTDASPTAERDRLIVELATEGLTQREIAEKVSASRSTVSRVVRRYEDQKAERGRDEELELAPA